MKEDDNGAQGALERLESELGNAICVAIHPPTGFVYDFDISMAVSEGRALQRWQLPWPFPSVPV